MKKPFGALWRFAIAAAVSVALLFGIYGVITQPVEQQTRHYSADFTDISGLHEGADVRVRGVRVGKVDALEPLRQDGRTVARVAFTLDSRYGITSTTRLAVKFQALTGLRYLDVAGPNEGVATANTMQQIPTTMTVPSFDVTVLFNGLQPVLATLQPDDINRFTDNVAAFLQGDGEGLGPMLDSIRKLTALVSNREQVISTLVNNLKTLADNINGRSDRLIEILRLIQVPIDSGMSVLDEFRKSQIYGPGFADSVLRLLDAAGLKPGIDIGDALDRAYANTYLFLDTIKRVPVIWENIAPPPTRGTPMPCSKGRAELPLPMDVLLNGRKVVLCNR